MRVLVVGEAAKVKAARVVDHARNHHYRPGPGVPAPGEDPAFTAQFDSYRAVFSFTHADGQIWRHLSVSVPAALKFPHPAAAFTLAGLFGFTGWDGQTIDRAPDDWMVNADQAAGCVVLAQTCGEED